MKKITECDVYLLEDYNAPCTCGQHKSVYCEVCKKRIPLDECVEVNVGILQHESENGYIHTT